MRAKLLLTQIKCEFWEHKTGFVYAPLLVTGLVLLILLAAAFYSREIIGAIAHDEVQVHLGASSVGESAPSDALIAAEKHKTETRTATTITEGRRTETTITESVAFDCNDAQLSTTGCQYEYKYSNSSGNAGVMERFGKRDFETVIARQPTFMGAPVMIALFTNWVLLAITYCIVLAIYSHGTLLEDRKSRDILFWRSMPVSETVNVLVKLGIIIILPAVALLLTSLLVGLCATAATLGVLSMLDAPVAMIVKSIIASGAQWAPFKIAGVGLLMFLLLLPVFSFFLFCSALAKKSPVLLSSVLPIGVWFLDSILADLGVNLHVREVWRAYSDVLARVLSGFMDNPNGQFAAVGWQAYLVIFAVAAVFIGGAIWLRNNRYEI